MLKTARIARSIQGFERSAFIVFFAMIGLVACEDGTQKPSLPEYNLCDSDADCSELTPRCVGLDLSASGKVTKTCVKSCDPVEARLGAHQCPHPRHPTISSPTFACVGLNGNGHLDPTSSDGACVPLCEDLGVGSDYQPTFCPPIGPRDERRTEPMVCARMEYDERGPLRFCIEPDVPTPPAIIPRYRNCHTSADCSPITPECRYSRYGERDRAFGFCTLSCEADEDCPIDPHTSEGPTPGRCLGIDADGLVDLASDDKVCFPGCGGYGCFRGAGTPEQMPGICKLVDPEGSEDYGWFCL